MSRETAVLDNRLALSQLVDRCEHADIAWALYRESSASNPYEIRIHETLARGIYRGRTATHAASKAIAALDVHRIGWVDD